MFRPCFSFLFLICSLVAFGQQQPARNPNNADFTVTQSLQDYRVEIYTTKQGLPQNSVKSICQTHDGYLWMGTFGGLVRFDGIRFVAPTHEVLMNQRVIVLFEDRQNRLWIGTEDNGAFCLIGDSLTHYGPGQALENHGVHRIFEDADGTIMIAVYNQGLFYFQDGSFHQHQSPLFKKNTISHALRTSSGSFMFSTTEGLIEMTKELITTVISREDLGDKELRYTVELPSGNILVGTSDGLFQLDKAQNRLNDDSTVPAEVSIHQHMVDSKGQQWMGSWKRGLWLKANNEQLSQLSGQDFINGSITKIFEDQENNVWVGTDGGGLAKFSKPEIQSINAEKGLSQDIVLSVYEDAEQRVWAGTYSNGLTVFDGAEIQTFLPSLGIWALASDGKGTVWAGSFSEGLAEIKKVGGEYQVSSIPEYEGELILATYYDKLRQRLLVGGDKGLTSFKEGVITRIPLSGEKSNKRVRTILTTPSGAIWLGTWGGGIIRLENGKEEQFGKVEGLLTEKVRSLYYDKEGLLWVGTYGGGLFLFKDGSFTQISMKSGLYDNIVSAILVDENEHFWMSCNRGVYTVARSELIDFAEGRISKVNCKVYTDAHGMGSSETNGGFQPAAWKRQNGQLIFPTMNGMAIISPQNLKTSNKVPPLIIESVHADNQLIRIKNREITIPPGTRNLELSYSAPSFKNPELIRFRYLLEGYDPKWIEAGYRRAAFYPEIPPGKYTFRVMAANRDGIWSSEDVTITLDVQPFFYQTSAFKWFVVLAIVASILGVFKWRNDQAIRREKTLKKQVDDRTQELQNEKKATQSALETVVKQATELEELDQAKDKFYANISHELRTPLTLVYGPLKEAIQNRFGQLNPLLFEQLRTAAQNTDHVLKLITQILDISKLETGRMSLSLTSGDLHLFCKNLHFRFSAGAESALVTLYGDGHLSTPIFNFDAEKLEKILSNLLSNALKFTPPEGNIRFEWKEEGNGVLFTIVDSGVGIEPNDLTHIFERFYRAENNGSKIPGSGIGLSLAKELVDLHQGKISVESTQHQGSTFSVWLPLKPAEAVAPAKEIDLAAPSASIDSATEMLEDQQRTVLVVDDHPDIRKFVRLILEPEFRVIEAEDGMKAWETTLQALPDMIVSDVMMPQLDGLGLLKLLRSNPDTAGIPVMLLTAKASHQSRMEGWESGADDHLPKPFDPAELSIKVKNMIASRLRLRIQLTKEHESVEVAVEVPDSSNGFKTQFESLIQKEISNPAFRFSEEEVSAFHMSASKFQRSVKRYFGETPTAYLRKTRLKLAHQMLLENKGNVSEIAYGVGFQCLSYFSKCYKEQYKELPSATVKNRT